MEEEINYLSVLNVVDAEVVDINKESIDKITNIIKKTLISLNISLEGKSIYYQRSNKVSILAIKLANGDEQDTKNYMFNGADATYFEKSRRCDVFLHADAFVAQPSIRVAGMISKDIVNFFDEMESYYLENDLMDMNISFRVPLGRDNDKEIEQDTGIKGLIKRFFKKEANS